MLLTHYDARRNSVWRRIASFLKTSFHVCFLTCAQHQNKPNSWQNKPDENKNKTKKEIPTRENTGRGRVCVEQTGRPNGWFLGCFTLNILGLCRAFFLKGKIGPRGHGPTFSSSERKHKKRENIRNNHSMMQMYLTKQQKQKPLPLRKRATVKGQFWCVLYNSPAPPFF